MPDEDQRVGDAARGPAPRPGPDGANGPGDPAGGRGWRPPAGASAPVVAQIAFTVPPAAADDFPAAVREVLAVLGGAAGFRRGRVARALDAQESWLLITEWDGPGPWRRALSLFDVRRTLTPLLVHAVDAPGAFEVLAAADAPSAGGADLVFASDRAADADTAAPGRRPAS
ncbi:Antibiotic biosynthesis monooxygenase [Frankia canadensis]|uniref:Antibiotic biosynthesis monooxygenase n=1 Tax=Frankia canadensis TaxID=1836972 RepID=A0A2I2KZN6_9ACTN|nr:antibiotic biosynthesis monooxygenase [Frankia canadensis]SNQ51117.1 Antibiotic biosynthesis monooxygenase [Frankia canadensis]SOU58407.1 Antibiotic biosynthesis monooxygenase [Frankia canadensis]